MKNTDLIWQLPQSVSTASEPANFLEWRISAMS